VRPTTPPPPSQEFVALTANRNGLWAGFAFQQSPLEFAVITWRKDHRHAKRRPAKALMRIPAAWSIASVDDAGDVAFNQGDGRMSVRRAGGEVVISGAAGHSLYGYSTEGLYRYDLTSVRAGQDIAPSASLGRGRGVSNYVTAASRRGDLVTGIGSQLLRTASGKWFPLPKAEAESPTTEMGFDATGRFAFTSARDGRVHFVTYH
jgi:hypothetical protein